MKLKDINIYLVDTNSNICSAWTHYFDKIHNIKVFNNTLDHAYRILKPEAIAAPGNSFGIMDGGFDGALTELFGKAAIDTFTESLQKSCLGELTPGHCYGSCLKIDDSPILLYIPTMRRPEKIRDARIVYSCFRSLLKACLLNDIASVIVPGFGGCTGDVNPTEIAFLMKAAYESIQHEIYKLEEGVSSSWENIYRWEEGYDELHQALQNAVSYSADSSVESQYEKEEIMSSSTGTTTDTNEIESLEQYKKRVFGGI